MVPCPQSPPPSLVSCYSYPSPRSKSPPSATQLKESRKLPILKYPLTDITNFALVQATLELSNLNPILAKNECSAGQAREIANDAPSKKGRGKNRRGRPRGIRASEVGNLISAGVLRSPIPLASPRSSTASSHESPSKATIARSRTPRRRVLLVSTPTPETPRHACKRKKRWSSTSPYGNRFSPPSPPIPPSPTPIARQLTSFHHSFPNTSGSLRRLSPLPLPHFPVPPPSAPWVARSSSHYNGQQLALLPAVNLGFRNAQGQTPKKCTKRELAVVQWQITMHRSLAWRITRDHLNTVKHNMCEQCTTTGEEPCHHTMDFAQGGLKIAFEGPACPCAASGDEPEAKSHGVRSHWTDALDRELVKRLWVKLIAQGCRTLPIGNTNRPQEVATPFPTLADSPREILLPSGGSEQPLAPAIQLPLVSYPTSEPQVGPRMPPRRKVSAITSSLHPWPHVSSPNLSLSSQKPSTIPALPTSPLTAHPDSQLQMTRISAPVPRGTLSSTQLAAQAMLRHGEARSKPMKRGRPPGIMPRGSSLRHNISMEYAD